MLPETGPSGEVRLVLPSDQIVVHQALKSLFAGQQLGQLEEAVRSSAEIVLAEVLNNIVEHAYAVAQGEIEVTINVANGMLECSVADSGKAMPGGHVPGGRAPALGNLADLPEGGFGWLLIRSLALDLRYSRIEGRNCLSFRLETGQS
jgi:serine/threonine-protein kinase RsbW